MLYSQDGKFGQKPKFDLAFYEYYFNADLDRMYDKIHRKVRFQLF
jgi:hypothetical protein